MCGGRSRRRKPLAAGHDGGEPLTGWAACVMPNVQDLRAARQRRRSVGWCALPYWWRRFDSQQWHRGAPSRGGDGDDDEGSSHYRGPRPCSEPRSRGRWCGWRAGRQLVCCDRRARWEPTATWRWPTARARRHPHRSPTARRSATACTRGARDHTNRRTKSRERQAVCAGGWVAGYTAKLVN